MTCLLEECCICWIMTAGRSGHNQHRLHVQDLEPCALMPSHMDHWSSPCSQKLTRSLRDSQCMYRTCDGLVPSHKMIVHVSGTAI